MHVQDVPKDESEKLLSMDDMEWGFDPHKKELEIHNYHKIKVYHV